MKCHCGEKLTKHGELRHCETCGCYYLESGELAPDHTACRDAYRAEIPIAPPAEPEPPSPAAATEIPEDVVKGGKEGVADADLADPEDTSTPERRTRRKS